MNGFANFGQMMNKKSSVVSISRFSNNVDTFLDAEVQVWIVSHVTGDNVKKE